MGGEGMTFSTFMAARDAWYAAALLLGAAAGWSLRAFFTRSRHTAFGTFVLYFISAAVFAAACVLIFSRGAVLYDGALVRISLCIFGLAALGAAFPLYAGWPLTTLAGVAVIWAGVVFLRHPSLPDPMREGEVAVHSGDLIPVIGGEVRYFPAEPDGLPLFREEFAVLSPSKHRLVFSFIAGERILSYYDAGR